MAKNIIRLTESDLHKIVKESVQKILSEIEIGEPNVPTYKEGDIVYWMYYYSSTFPNFYKVIKVGPKSIWIAKMGTKRTNATMGYGSWDSIPDEANVSDKVKRIALRPNGKAYINYVGHKQELQVWNGRPIQSMSD